MTRSTLAVLVLPLALAALAGAVLVRRMRPGEAFTVEVVLRQAEAILAVPTEGM